MEGCKSFTIHTVTLKSCTDLFPNIYSFKIDLLRENEREGGGSGVCLEKTHKNPMNL